MKINNYDQLLVATSKGNKSAFKKLYIKCSPKILSLYIHLTGDKVLAEELLTKSFIIIWNKSYTYSPDNTRAITWIIGVIYNLINHHKSSIDTFNFNLSKTVFTNKL